MENHKCIEWQGKQTGGFGVCAGHLAHRQTWQDKYGPIPDGLLIHHTCGNHSCVNVDHLVAVSKAEHGIIHRHPEFRRGGKSRRWRLKEPDIREALRLCEGIKARTAIRLECTRVTLDNYLRDMKIDVREYRKTRWNIGKNPPKRY